MHAMTLPIRNTLTVLTLAVAIGIPACSDKNPAAPDDAISNPPSGMVVSNAQAGSGTIAYVSAVPGTFPWAASVAVRNQTRGGASQRIGLIDGGLDPVRIEAAADDKLLVTVFMIDGGSTSLALRVPPRRQPRVVRTNPAKGRTDVALSAPIAVMFSEPLDRSSVTSSSVALLQDGSALNGRVQYQRTA